MKYTASLLSTFLAAGLIFYGVTQPCLAQPARDLLNQAQGEFASGKLKPAAKLYRQALQADPANVDAKLGLAITLKEQGNLDEAMGLLNDLTQSAPGLAPAYYHLGNIYEAKGNQPQAKASYQKFVQASGGRLPPDPKLRLKLHEMGLL